MYAEFLKEVARETDLFYSHYQPSRCERWGNRLIEPLQTFLKQENEPAHLPSWRTTALKLLFMLPAFIGIQLRLIGESKNPGRLIVGHLRALNQKNDSLKQKMNQFVETVRRVAKNRFSTIITPSLKNGIESTSEYRVAMWQSGSFETETVTDLILPRVMESVHCLFDLINSTALMELQANALQSSFRAPEEFMRLFNAKLEERLGFFFDASKSVFKELTLDQFLKGESMTITLNPSISISLKPVASFYIDWMQFCYLRYIKLYPQYLLESNGVVAEQSESIRQQETPSIEEIKNRMCSYIKEMELEESAIEVDAFFENLQKITENFEALRQSYQK